jgi:hypothetical protein
LKRLLPIVALLSLLLLAAIHSDACSLASCSDRGVEMRSNFAVRIKFDGKPLAGVTIKATSAGSERFTGVTLADGTIRINLPPGDYWLSAELLGISAADQCFHVAEQPSRKAKRKLTFVWGDYADATKRIAGRLIDSQPGTGSNHLWNLAHRTDIPIAGATLKLQNPITGEVYSTKSAIDGNFAFETVPYGTYVLHIAGEGAGLARDYDATDLLIELNPTANRNVLLLTRRNAGGGSCGGTYLDLQNVN